MLTIRNLDVRYGQVQALRRVSLHVSAGEIVALIGANGAGKTTLLSAISGLVRPAGGEASFEDRALNGLAPDAIVRLGISHVPERRLVFKPMSVADNLLLGAYSRGRLGRRPEVEPDLKAVYAMFPVLWERRSQPAGTLSGGEQQMLAMGRALMARPRLLLLDEPGLGLAPLVTREIFRRIASLRAERGLTVLLVEQNARSALAVADRGYVMETGRVVLSAPAEELLANRDVQRAYLGRDVDAPVE